MSTGMLETVRTAIGQRSNGGRLVSVEGKDLPLREAHVTARAEGGLARVVLRQLFTNPHAEPLKCSYTMPLPADGAVAGYEFRIGGRRVVGKVEGRAQARESFERALVEGRTAGLLDQERSNLFTQQIGNVPPGKEVAVDLTIDQRLAWLYEGLWEWRFPTVVAPRYLGAEGRVADAGAVTVEVADAPPGVRARLDLAIADALVRRRDPESPSHTIAARLKRGTTNVTFTAGDGVALDRDIVVRWAVPRPRPGVTLRCARADDAWGPAARNHAYGLLTIVPPEAPGATHPRDLILLIDTSGSMLGEPLAHARRVVRALIDSLDEKDRLEMIEFSSEPRRFGSGPVAVTPEARREAHAWVEALNASGGTEMLSGVRMALEPLRPEAQRQVVLVTDGQIGFESEIVRAVYMDLPARSRLHAAGVGRTFNRALLHPLARAGRGVEVQISPGEDPERGAARLVAATRAPVVTDLQIEGDAVVGRAPRCLPDLMAGAPVLACVGLRPEGGRIVVRGRTAAGPWEERLKVRPTAPGAGDAAVIKLHAREEVEDLEMDLAVRPDPREIEREIERLGLDFSIATRLTSWVAISEEQDVDPRLPVRQERIPQALPHGLSAEGLGLLRSGGHVNALSLASVIEAEFSAPRLAKDAEEGVYYMIDPSHERRPRGGSTPMRAFRLPLARDASADAARASLRPHAKGARHEPEGGSRRETPRPPDPGLRLPSSPARTVHVGRWVPAGQDDLQIVEFAVAVGFDWRPALRATIEMRDGLRREVEVDAHRSTLFGFVPGGSLVRLALTLARDLAAGVAAVVVTSGGTEVRIEL